MRFGFVTLRLDSRSVGCELSIKFSTDFISDLRLWSRYWLKYIASTPGQLVAAALLISLWSDEQCLAGIWITAFLIIIVAVNYYFARFLGAYAVVLAAFEIAVVLGLLILSAILAFRSGSAWQQGIVLWGDTGAFGKSYGGAAWLGKLSAICVTLPSATFAYLGSEMIGMTILQTPDPRRTTARAIRMTSYRIVAFNIVCIILVVMLIPCGLVHLDKDEQEPKTSLSAFVMAIRMAGIPVLPHILNACILVFALSAATFGLYLSTGTMYRMSNQKTAPTCLSITDRRGIPILALLLCSALATLAYLSVSRDSKVVFRYFVNLVSMFSILTWISILVTHLSFERARRAQKVPDAVLAFKAPLGRFGSWIALVSCIAMSLMRIIGVLGHFATHFGTHYKGFITSYLGVPLYLALLLGYKAATKCKRVDPEETSLFSDHTIVDAPDPGSPDVEIALNRHKSRAKRFVRRWVV